MALLVLLTSSSSILIVLLGVDYPPPPWCGSTSFLVPAGLACSSRHRIHPPPTPPRRPLQSALRSLHVGPRVGAPRRLVAKCQRAYALHWARHRRGPPPLRERRRQSRMDVLSTRASDVVGARNSRRLPSLQSRPAPIPESPSGWGVIGCSTRGALSRWHALHSATDSLPGATSPIGGGCAVGLGDVHHPPQLPVLVCIRPGPDGIDNGLLPLRFWLRLLPLPFQPFHLWRIQPDPVVTPRVLLESRELQTPALMHDEPPLKIAEVLLHAVIAIRGHSPMAAVVL